MSPATHRGLDIKRAAHRLSNGTMVEPERARPIGPALIAAAVLLGLVLGLVLLVWLGVLAFSGYHGDRERSGLQGAPRVVVGLVTKS